VTDLLKNLNPQQQKAVQHKTGPAIVLAGAGSGKTRVLTTRAAWLIQEKNVAPENILLMTFTNKAAGEMNKRVMDLTGFKLNFSGTFHSLCAKILRKEAHHLSLSPGFSIYDTSDQVALVKQIYKANNFDTKKYKPQAVLGIISGAKNEMLSPKDYENIANSDWQKFSSKIYKLYQKALLEQQALDFDDLLLTTVSLLQNFKDVLKKYQNQFEHVLVDEYQDTNKAQYFLTKSFALPQNNLYVVGDFSQSIYAWRGADYRNLMHLKQDFSDINEYRLEQNYRSTQTILDAATQVIQQNSSHPILSLWTNNIESEKIKIFETDSNQHEAQVVADVIQRDCFSNDYSNIAILYRTNAQSRSFEEEFVKRGIPYRLVGGVKFYERKEIKDLIAYLRFTLNSQDTVSKERILKIGKRRFESFNKWLDQQQSVEGKPPYQLLNEIINITSYLDKFDKKNPEDEARLENIQELLNTASVFNDVINFLENVALVQDTQLHDNLNLETPNVITLMSLHSAKGLEFPIVFMVGMEEELLPHSRSLWEKDQMEEERRLCYVGITRAKEKLFFTHARSRFVYGKSNNTIRSRFLSEISPDLLEIEGASPNVFKSKSPKRRIVIDDDSIEALLNDEMDIKAFLEK
jgi:DNA helicase II / ATP-dependent DNA helicase PcrA